MRKIHSFTLIELLIAVSIFSVIVLSIYSVFQTGILSYRKIDSAFEVYQTGRIILNKIERDLKNCFAYIDAENNSRFMGDGSSLNFFSIVDSFEKGESYTNICRVKYELSDGILKRTCYKGQDALKKEEDLNLAGQELFLDIKDISFEYAYATNDSNKPYDWQDSWPKENDEEQKKSLPLAIKIKLSLIEKNKRQKEQERIVEFNKTVAMPLGGTN